MGAYLTGPDPVTFIPMSQAPGWHLVGLWTDWTLPLWDLGHVLPLSVPCVPHAHGLARSPSTPLSALKGSGILVCAQGKTRLFPPQPPGLPVTLWTLRGGQPICWVAGRLALLSLFLQWVAL